MAKYLKLQSIILCVCIFISAMSGLSVFAAEPLELVNWDADADFITLDFNQAINVANADIELYADGVAVTDYTFNIQNHKSTVQSIGSSYYTYLLAPADGLEADVIYDLVINKIEAADGTGAFEGFEKTFLVEFIADFDDFVPFKQTTPTTNILTKNEDTSNFTIEDAMLTSGSTGFSAGWLGGIAALIGEDATNGSSFLNVAPGYESSAKNTWTEKDYTFKVTYTPDENLKTEKINMGVAQSLGTNYTNNANYKYYGFYIERNTTYTQTAAAANITYQNGAAKNSDARVLTGSNRMKSFVYAGGIELKFAVKNGTIHGFVNGKKVFDYQLDESPAGFPFIQVNVKGFFDTTATAGAYALSKPVVTRCVPVQEASIDKEVVDVTDSVVVTFDAALDDSAAEKISLIDEEGNKVEGAKVTLSDDKTQATISFEDLAYRSEFFLSIGKLKLEDGSSAYFPDFYIETVEPTIELYSFTADGGDVLEGTVTLEAVLANNLQETPWTFTATIAIYNSRGQMVKVAGDTYTLGRGEDTTVTLNNFVCEDGETYTAKCFVWDSFTGMNSQFEAVIE